MSSSPTPEKRTAIIFCGALARELVDIVQKHGWNAKVFGISALDHMFPERIAPDVEKRYLEIRDQFDRVLIGFGDCGSQGAVDTLADKYGLERIEGPHCYEMYSGPGFQELMDEEPGTFFLTDFLVRGFRGTIMKGLGLDRFPQLKDDYFRNYKRIVYLAQKPDPELIAQAQTAADYLELPLVVQETGYGLLEERLVAMMNG